LRVALGIAASANSLILALTGRCEDGVLVAILLVFLVATAASADHAIATRERK
jgi:hypothetical protein